uniref:Uncharacterized protein n=1 Tax=Oryza brachyantha TaxID=4533 RepID=J3LRV9_ORYBR
MRGEGRPGGEAEEGVVLNLRKRRGGGSRRGLRAHAPTQGRRRRRRRHHRGILGEADRRSNWGGILSLVSYAKPQ